MRQRGDLSFVEEPLQIDERAAAVLAQAQLLVALVLGQMQLHGTLQLPAQPDAVLDACGRRGVEAVQRRTDHHRGAFFAHQLAHVLFGLGDRLVVAALRGFFAFIGVVVDDVVVHAPEDEAQAHVARGAEHFAVKLVAFIAVQIVADHHARRAEQGHAREGARAGQIDAPRRHRHGVFVDRVAAPGAKVPGRIDDVGVNRLLGMRVGVEKPARDHGVALRIERSARGQRFVFDDLPRFVPGDHPVEDGTAVVHPAGKT